MIDHLGTSLGVTWLGKVEEGGSKGGMRSPARYVFFASMWSVKLIERTQVIHARLYGNIPGFNSNLPTQTRVAESFKLMTCAAHEISMVSAKNALKPCSLLTYPGGQSHCTAQ